MTEAFNTLDLAAALDDVKFPLDDRPKTITDLPKELLVKIFEAIGDLRWVSHTIPLVCKEWAELYRSQDASPLHEPLELDFVREVESASATEGLPPATTEAEAQERDRRHPVRAARVISWAEGRAGWVRKLHIEGGFPGALEDFSPKDLGTLVAVVAPSLTMIRIGLDLNERYKKCFWKTLPESVATKGRLFSLYVHGNVADVPESVVDPLAQLAGSLEELVLHFIGGDLSTAFKLSRFPESVCTLTELRRLNLFGHRQITAIPAQISSLKKLEDLKVDFCRLSSLPKELGELTRLTNLHLSVNQALGNAPQDEAFPAELGRMKSLRELLLHYSGLRAVPAFVGELESLEKLGLSGNMNLRNAPQDEAFPAELGRKMKSLRILDLACCGLGAVPAFVGELEALECLDLSENNMHVCTSLDLLIKGCPCLRKVTLNKGKDTAP